MSDKFKNQPELPLDDQQAYYRRNARGEGNAKQGPRGHDVGLRDEKNDTTRR